MKVFRACVKLFLASMFLLSISACKPASPGVVKPEFVSPTMTAAANSPAPAGDSASCPPQNVAFPDPDKLADSLGWQYLRNPAAFQYPQEEFGTLLSLNKDYDYGISAYHLDDNSFMLVLEKFLCNDGTGLPAWEIADVVRTRQLAQNELIASGSNCVKDGEPTAAYQFVVMDQSNTGQVYSAWSIDQNKKIVEVPVDGLVCSFGG
jgi:hypothetical protein